MLLGPDCWTDVLVEAEDVARVVGLLDGLEPGEGVAVGLAQEVLALLAKPREVQVDAAPVRVGSSALPELPRPGDAS